MPDCFVIMPISTPEALLPAYGKDAEHFSHVLKHLFIPAIKEAAFSPIPPVAQGADVIQAEIVKNLETADLVLCDISTLNPNVFFELGCRTALNKPVCYVMDDLTRGIPFDTGIINHYTYSHLIVPWTLDDEVERLAEHIRVSADRSKNKNMLWEFFGLRSSAKAIESRGEESDLLSYLTMQVDAIKKRMDEEPTFTTLSPITVDSSWDSIDLGDPAEEYGTMLKRHWDNIIAESENTLREIAKMGKQRPPLSEEVKWLVEHHIKSLAELIKAEPIPARADRARKLREKYLALLSPQ